MHRQRVAHRFALRRELTLRDGSAGVSLALHLPAPACKQARPLSLAAPARANKKAASAARARSALRDTGTAGPRTARRSAPRAKARGAVTPSGETSLARYNNPPLRASPTARAPQRLRPSAWPGNHRSAARLTLALARRRRASPSPGNRRAARPSRPRSALRETDTAGPRTARRSAPHAKPRGAVTPSGETSLARYSNRRAAHIAIARACATAPAFGLA